MIVPNKPGKITSWGHHDTPGWYIGQSLDHYRCIQWYMPATEIFRITDKLQYNLKAFYFPKTNTEDDLRQEIGDIITIMKDPPNTPSFFSYGDATKN